MSDITVQQLKRPRDPNQLAKPIVDIATEKVEETPPKPASP